MCDLFRTLFVEDDPSFLCFHLGSIESVTAISGHLRPSGCPQRKKASTAPPSRAAASSVAVASPVVAIGRSPLGCHPHHRPCCISWRHVGKRVYRGSHSCYSRFDRIYLMQFGAFDSVVERWLFRLSFHHFLDHQSLP